MTAQAPQIPYPAHTQSLRSEHDFPATVSRLLEALHSRGLTLFADIDQRAAAESAGTTLRPTRLFLFGNPKGGTPVMEANPHAAVELPLRAVIWEDERGTTHIDYAEVGDVLLHDYELPQSVVAPVSGVRRLLQAVAGGE